MRTKAVPVVLASLLVALPSGAGGGTSHGYEGTNCTYVYAPFVADGYAARAEVPADFLIPGEVAGVAVLFLIVAACDIAVDGSVPVHTNFTDAGVFVLGPGGEPGLHLYWAWHVSDNPALAGLDQQLGVDATLLPAMAVTYMAALPLSRLTADAPWAPGPYAFHSKFLGQDHPGLDGTVVWWHRGPLGLLRHDQTFVHDRELVGLAEVRTTPGSRLADLIGCEVLTEANLNLADLRGAYSFAGA